jgi:hypothetical protein
MKNPAIAKGWTLMPRGGDKSVRARSAWREVAVAWVWAAALIGALVMAMPIRGAERVPRLWSLAPAAGHVHARGADAEGPASDEACSDRDYASERC